MLETSSGDSWARPHRTGTSSTSIISSRIDFCPDALPQVSASSSEDEYDPVNTSLQFSSKTPCDPAHFSKRTRSSASDSETDHLSEQNNLDPDAQKTTYAPKDAPLALLEKSKDGYFQCIILGLCSFLGPSTAMAVNHLGASTMQDYLDGDVDGGRTDGIAFVSAATAAYFTAVLFTRVGPKPLIILGVICHILLIPIDAVIETMHFSNWAEVLISVTVGIIYGLTSVSLLAVLIALPPRDQAGFYIATFLAFENGCHILFGIFEAITQWKYHDPDFISTEDNLYGQVFPEESYDYQNLAFTGSLAGVMGAFAIGVLFLIAPLDKIRRSDGTRLEFQGWIGIYHDFKESAYIGLDPFVCKMFVVFVFADFSSNYITSYMIGYMFNHRSRALVKIIFWTVTMIAGFLCGWMLDRPRWSPRQKMVHCLSVLLLTSLMASALALIIQFTVCDGRVDKNQDPDLVMEHNMTYAVAWFPQQGNWSGCEYLHNNAELQLMQCAHEGFYGWCDMDIVAPYTNRICSRDASFWDVCFEVDTNYLLYALMPIIYLILISTATVFIHIMTLWMIGAMAGPKNTAGARYVAIYFAWRSVGRSIAWLMDLFDAMLYRYQGVICAILNIASVGAMYMVVRTIEQAIWKRENIQRMELERVMYMNYYAYYDSEDDFVEDFNG